MWIVAKHNHKEFNTLLLELEKKIGKELNYYRPKILISYKPKKYKYILSDYAFFYNENFKNNNLVLQLKNIKGLKYFLNFYKTEQNSIKSFINFCKNHEDEDKNLQTSFFEKSNFDKIKLLDGPFKNLIFSIVDYTNKNFKLNIGELKLTLKKQKNNTVFVF